MLNDFARAEDVMQETFLSVARAAKKYEPRGRFRTWIMRIARNQCLNRIESERRRRAARRVGAGELQLDLVAERHLPQAHQREQPVSRQHVEHVLHAEGVVVAHALDAVGKDLVDGLVGLDEPLVGEQILLDAGHLDDPDLGAGRQRERVHLRVSFLCKQKAR